MIRTSIILASILAVGCGGSDAVEVDNVAPRGSVGGLILDAESRSPLEGVSVGMLAGGRVFEPVVTGADGSFQFEDVPGGGVLVTVAANASHHGATLHGTLPTAAGDFPLDNATLTLGPIGLLPVGSTFEFRVLDDRGAPVSGYAVGVETHVQYIDYSSGSATAVGELFQQVQTDGDGYATATSVPNYFAIGSINDAITLFLPPRDGDSDGIFEFPGGDMTFNRRDVDPTPDVILEAGLATELVVRASTIPALAAPVNGSVPAVMQPTGTIFVTFNLPVESTVAVTLTDEQGTAVAVPTSALGIRDDTLEISLGGLGLDFGAEYNLAIHAVAAIGDRQVIGDFAASFFTVSMDTAVSVVDVVRDGATQLVTVTFNEPIGFGNIGANSSLSGGNCVTYFGFDINGANGQGDYVNELGSGSCNVTFGSSEWDPPGLPTLSGYSTRWQFYAPLQVLTPDPLPGGIAVHLLFDRVSNAGAIVERVDGRPVENQTFTLP